MQEDLSLCANIIRMRQYAHVKDRESTGAKMTPDELRFMVELERAAGC